MDSLGVEWSSEFDVDSSLKEKGLLEVSICSAMTWLRCLLAVPLALSRSPTPCSQLLAQRAEGKLSALAGTPRPGFGNSKEQE